MSNYAEDLTGCDKLLLQVILDVSSSLNRPQKNTDKALGKTIVLNNSMHIIIHGYKSLLINYLTGGEVVAIANLKIR